MPCAALLIRMPWEPASMWLPCYWVVRPALFFAGTLADQYGRRTIMFAAALFFMMSAWGSGIAATSAQFVLFRIIGGFAVGAASILTPAYISEIAPSRMRGRLATLQQLAIVIGLFCCFSE